MAGHPGIPSVLLHQRVLAIIRRPAQLASRPMAPLILQQGGIFVPPRISETHPREMEHLMDQNPRKLTRVPQQIAFQDHKTLGYIGTGVDRLSGRLTRVKLASIGYERRTESDGDGRSFQFRKQIRRGSNERALVGEAPECQSVV